MRLQNTTSPPTDQIAEKGTCGDRRGEGGAGGRSHGERYPCAHHLMALLGLSGSDELIGPKFAPFDALWNYESLALWPASYRRRNAASLSSLLYTVNGL